MHVDAITLAAVADEWRSSLIGARIDTIIAPTEYAIALQCYAHGAPGQSGQNRWLYLSAHPQLARAHLTALKPAKIVSEPSSFIMLLRKYLEGTRIEAVTQPRWERVIEILASHRGDQETGERVRYRLIIEIMGLTAAQLEMSAAEEAAEPNLPPGRKSRSRPSGQPTLWQLLTRNLLGFSPLLAREAVYRTTNDTETPITQDKNVWEELAWNVRELAALYDNHSWKPQIVERLAQSAGSSPLFIAFAPYTLEQYAAMPDVRSRRSPSINAILDEYYAGAEWRDAMESVRTPVKKVLQTQLERCKRKAELLQKELAVSEEANRYRLQADLLLAYQHEVKQGQPSAVVQNFFEGQEASSLVTIPLDPRYDAVGNANRLYHKYHKLRRALSLIPGQIEQNATELATIEQFLADLMLADIPAEVALVKAEVQTAGYIRGKKFGVSPAGAQKKTHKGKGGKPSKGKPIPPGGGVPLHVQSRDGFAILIGKNSRQNEEVTFHQATSNDMWLHARGVPGSHVIIKAGGRDIPRSTIEQAASLAAYYSQARGSTSVPIDYTLQRYVRHMKGGGPGLVIYERERTIYAMPKNI